jgi:hypothetical protein
MAEPRNVCLRAVRDSGATPASRASKPTLRLPPPSALHKETRPYEVFEKDSTCQPGAPQESTL